MSHACGGLRSLKTVCIDASVTLFANCSIPWKYFLQQNSSAKESNFVLEVSSMDTTVWALLFMYWHGIYSLPWHIYLAHLAWSLIIEVFQRKKKQHFLRWPLRIWSALITARLYKGTCVYPRRTDIIQVPGIYHTTKWSSVWIQKVKRD